MRAHRVRGSGRGLTADPFTLQRFVDAQAGGVHDRALAELRGGRKRGHWMWFEFPQLVGLGSSPVARHFAIGSPAEARAHLAHSLLGPRLVECCEALLAGAPGDDATAVLGAVDALKLRSSMTLFDRAGDGARPVFAAVLARFHAGRSDPATDRLLAG